MRRRWELMTSDEIRDTVASGMDLALFPVGATEQHGPHLATGTDTVSPEEIAWRVSDATGAVVLPALPYGLSLGHTTHWPGTLSLHPQTMSQVVVEIGRWVVSLFDCAPSAQKAYTRDGFDIHANQSETSILMHLRPEMVRADRLVDEPDVTPGLVFSYDMKATTRSGVVGHARRASAEDGKALVELLVDELSKIVARALVEQWPEPPGPS